jgi:hypothetical protein
MSPDGLNTLSNLFTIADKYGAPLLKDRLISHLRVNFSAYPDAFSKAFSKELPKTCQDVMSAEEFVGSRGSMVQMAYKCDTPGIEHFSV